MPATKKLAPGNVNDFPVGTPVRLLVGAFTRNHATHTVIGHDPDGYLRIFPTFKPYMHRGNLVEPAESRITPEHSRIEVWAS